MKIVFWRNHTPREQRIATELACGAQFHGIDFEIRDKAEYGKGGSFEGPDPDVDCHMAYGVKSRDLLRDCQNAGVGWAIVDKGYTRVRGPHGVELFSRISVNEVYPTGWIREHWRRDPERLKRVNQVLVKNGRRPLTLGPRQRGGSDSPVVVAGSSEKFYAFFGAAPEPNFHLKLVRRIRKHLGNPPPGREQRRIVFRPKPSFHKKHKTTDYAYGADEFSPPDDKNGIHKVLSGAHCLVTFASNAACDAILAGVPAIVLGPHVTRPVAGETLAQLPEPFWAREAVREQWLANLAYEQWTLEEMRSGEAWAELIPRIEAGPRLAEHWYDVGTSVHFRRALGDHERQDAAH